MSKTPKAQKLTPARLLKIVEHLEHACGLARICAENGHPHRGAGDLMAILDFRGADLEACRRAAASPEC